MFKREYRRERIGSRFLLGARTLAGPAGSGLRWPHANGTGLETGRAAIGCLIDALGLGAGDRALLPAYLCDSIVAPFRTRGVDIDFYRVDARLEPDGADAQARLTPQTRLPVVLHYFGFPASAARRSCSTGRSSMRSNGPLALVGPPR